MKDEISALINDELDQTPDSLEDMYSNIGDELKQKEEEQNLFAEQQRKMIEERLAFQQKLKDLENLSGEELLKKHNEVMEEAKKYLDPNKN